jgi:hypothetical protein
MSPDAPLDRLKNGRFFSLSHRKQEKHACGGFLALTDAFARRTTEQIASGAVRQSEWSRT